MKSNILDDRNHVKRLVYADVDERLAKIRGQPYVDYRNAFENARINHIRTTQPLQISLELTSYCNLLCKMCYRNYRTNDIRAHMSLEMVDEIARQVCTAGISSIWVGSFTEATLHPEFETIMQKLADTNPLDFWLITNGTMLTTYLSEVLVELPLTKMSVSLDAASPEMYKEIRGGNLNKIERNIMNFIEVRGRKNSIMPFLRVSFVEMEENKHEIDAFKSKWQNIADIVDIQKKTDFSIMNKDASLISKANYSNFDCTDIYYQMIIKHDGQLLPCCCGTYETSSPIYFQDTSISEYWVSPHLLDFVESIESKNYADCCKRCISGIAL